MGLTADQQRIKALLTETITLLCKNGLHFKTEFCIEGLLGITLDRDNVFLININETIKTEASCQAPAVSRTSNSSFVTEAPSGRADVNLRHQRPLVAASDSHHASEVESCERLPPISSIQPSSTDIVVDKSRQIARRKRHHSASRSSSCSDFSVDQNVYGTDIRQSSAASSDVTNSSSFHHRIDSKSFIEQKGGLHFGLVPDSSDYKQSLCLSENPVHRDVSNIDGTDSSTCDRSSFDIINIKEESDDEIEQAVLDNQNVLPNYQRAEGQQSMMHSNRVQEHLYTSPPETGCSSWTSNRNQPTNCNSYQESLSSVRMRHYQATRMQRYSGSTRAAAENHVVYRCPECGKILTSALGLAQHIKSIHRSIFSYSCSICGKGFVSARDMRGHMSSKHNMQKDYRCPCGREFGYKRSLKEHLVACHGPDNLQNEQKQTD